LAVTGSCALCLAQVPNSTAPTTSAASADALFQEGSALLKAGTTEAACDKLAESQRVEPAIGTLGLLAFCHEQSGKLGTALREYAEVAELARLAGQAPRERVARERITELSNKVSRLAVQLSQPASEVDVSLDGRRLEPQELASPLPLDAGTYEVRVSGAGFKPWTQSLTVLADGSTVRLIAPRLERLSASPAPVAAAPEPVAVGTHPLRRKAMWASFALGGAGAVVGTYFGLSAMSARSDSRPHCQGNTCDQTGVDARERALERAGVSTVAFTIAAVGAGAGLVLLLTDHSTAEQRATLRLTPGAAALHWERRF
jgi:hypothetical protein